MLESLWFNYQIHIVIICWIFIGAAVSSFNMDLVWKSLTKEQQKDSGLAILFLWILAAIFWPSVFVYYGLYYIKNEINKQ